MEGSLEEPEEFEHMICMALVSLFHGLRVFRRPFYTGTGQMANGLKMPYPEP